MPNALSGRTAGIPNIVLIGAAAVAIWFLFLRGRASSSTPNAAAAGSQLSSGYSLGYAQGVQAAGPNPPPPATATSAFPRLTLGNPFGQDQASAGRASLVGMVPLYSSPGTGFQNIGTLAPPGTQVQATGPGQYDQASGLLFTPVSYGGQSYYVAQPNLTGGTGGGRSRGSRSSAPHWHEAHPLIGGPVLYPHYVRAVGGPRAHRSEIHRVARQAGIHPARVLMLNPHYTGRIRIA